LAGLEARNQAKMCGLGNNKADAQNNNKAKKKFRLQLLSKIETILSSWYKHLHS
jgi:hypothetical protein